MAEAEQCTQTEKVKQWRTHLKKNVSASMDNHAQPILQPVSLKSLKLWG